MTSYVNVIYKRNQLFKFFWTFYSFSEKKMNKLPIETVFVACTLLACSISAVSAETNLLAALKDSVALNSTQRGGLVGEPSLNSSAEFRDQSVPRSSSGRDDHGLVFYFFARFAFRCVTKSCFCIFKAGMVGNIPHYKLWLYYRFIFLCMPLFLWTRSVYI